MNKQAPPKNLEQYNAMSEGRQALWNDLGQIVTEMTKRSSLARASQKFGRDPRVIRRLDPLAFRKGKNGQYLPNLRHRLLRVLLIPTTMGVEEIGIRRFSQATLLADYWNAVQRFLETGDSSTLSAFEGKHVTDADGRQFPLITDTDELARLASAGVFSFESIYARAA